jgi:hypothetical protein
MSLATSYLRGSVVDLYKFKDKRNGPAEIQRKSSVTALDAIESGSSVHVSGIQLKRLEGLGPEDSLDSGMNSLISNSWHYGAPENDPWFCWILVPKMNTSQCFRQKMPQYFYLPKPLPPIVALTDTAIDLFGILFGLQGPVYQEILLDQMSKTIKLQQASVNVIAANVGNSSVAADARDRAVRKNMVVMLNSIMAILSVCRWVETGAGRKLPIIPIESQTLALTVNPNHQTHMLFHLDGRVFPLASELCLTAFSSNNAGLRLVAAETLGCLARIVATSAPPANPPPPSLTGGTPLVVGTKYPVELIKSLVDMILNASRDPNLRAGACIALACTIKSVGSMSMAPSQLKTLISVMSLLAVDANATVHSWTLYAFWVVIDVVGFQMTTVMGPKEVMSTVVGLLHQVISLETHRPFWDRTSQHEFELHPGIIDPYRSACRILHAVLGSFGPELQFGPGREMADHAVNLIMAVRRELNDRYLGLMPALSDSGSLDQLNSVPLVQKYRLGFISQSLAMAPQRIVPVTMFTSLSPYVCVATELVRCFHQFGTFGAIKSKNLSQFLLEWIQVLLVPSPSHAIPLSLRRASIKLLWHAVVAGWPAFGGPEKLCGEIPEILIEQLIYLLDSAMFREKIENGGGNAGTSEDDAFLSSIGGDSASGSMSAGSSNMSFSFVETEIQEILFHIIEHGNGGTPNKWIRLFGQILSRTIVQNCYRDGHSGTAIGGGLMATADVKQGNADVAEDNESDNEDVGNKNGVGDAGSVEGDGGPDDGDFDGVDEPEPQTKAEASGRTSPTKIDLAVSPTPASDTFLQQMSRNAILISPLVSSRLHVILLERIRQMIATLVPHAQKNPNLKVHVEPSLARSVAAKLKVKYQNAEDASAYLEDEQLPVVLRLPDLIRMAFNAATASYAEDVRLTGLQV